MIGELYADSACKSPIEGSNRGGPCSRRPTQLILNRVADPQLKERIEQLIAENPVLLFMKGTPEAPRCGFSMRVVQVLGALDVEYGAIDVLPALQPLREVTAEISDWQTFPQLYVNGELVGGCDIVEEMFDSGELADLLGAEQPSGAEAPSGGDGPPGQSPPLQIER
jgi:monothiol glutaredoxin